VSRLRNRIVSEKGDAVLYTYADAEAPRRLYLASSGRKTLLGETTDVNGFSYPLLSQDGRAARFYGRGYFMHTLRSGGRMRDSFSEWIQSDGDAFRGLFKATGLAADAPPANSIPSPRYFASSRAFGTDIIHAVIADRPHRGPQVLQMYYDRWPLLIDDETALAVYALVHISGPDGLEAIEGVRMHSLVNGVEQKDWQLLNPAWHNTPPIHYQKELFDDGISGGDRTAGDGVYTNSTIKAHPDSGFTKSTAFPPIPGSASW
jgi:hypothetical protein